MLLKPSDQDEDPIEHPGMDTIDESGYYQVYELTYRKDVAQKKTIIRDELERQQARDLVRQYRNTLIGDDIINKGYGFEKMTVEVSYEY